MEEERKGKREEGKEGGRRGGEALVLTCLVLFCKVGECVFVCGHKKSWLRFIFEGAKKKPVLVHTRYHTGS